MHQRIWWIPVALITLTASSWGSSPCPHGAPAYTATCLPERVPEPRGAPPPQMAIASGTAETKRQKRR